MSAQKILVTGGAGFIGSNLCERLARDKNNDVYSLDNYFTGSKDNHVEKYLKAVDEAFAERGRMMKRIALALALLAVSLLVLNAGCYTVLQHPTGGSVVQQDTYYRSCADCHADAAYYHPYSHPYYSSHYRWGGYYGDPWWYDDYYWYDPCYDYDDD